MKIFNSLSVIALLCSPTPLLARAGGGLASHYIATQTALNQSQQGDGCPWLGASGILQCEIEKAKKSRDEIFANGPDSKTIAEKKQAVDRLIVLYNTSKNEEVWLDAITTLVGSPLMMSNEIQEYAISQICYLSPLPLLESKTIKERLIESLRSFTYAAEYPYEKHSKAFYIDLAKELAYLAQG